MKINGTDVRTLIGFDFNFEEWPEWSVDIEKGPKRYDLKYHQHAVSIYENTDLTQTGALGTLKNPLAPSAPRAGLKTWKIAIMFRGDSQSLFRKAASDLVAVCAAKEAEYEFDGLEHHFRGVLTGYEAEELVPRRLYKVTLSVLGREIGEMQTYEFELPGTAIGSGTFGVVLNAGTAPAPAVMSLEQASVDNAVIRVNGALRDPVTLNPKTYSIGYRWLQDRTDIYSAQIFQFQHLVDGRRGIDAIFDRPYSIEKKSGTYEEQARASCTGAEMSIPALRNARTKIVPIESYGMPIFLPGETEITYSLEKLHENSRDPRAYGTLRLYVWPCYL